MAIVLFILGFTQLFLDMGLSTAILHKQDISKKEYGSLYWVNFIFSLVLYLLIWSIAVPVANFYQEPELINIMPIMGISIILSALGRQFRTIEEKGLNFKFISIVAITGSLLSLLVSAILAMNDFGVYALVYGGITLHLVTNLTFFVVGIYKNGLLFRLVFSETKPFLRIGLYHVGGQIINYFNRDLDILLIGKFFGSETLGGYSLAKELVFRPIKTVNPILTKVASPVLAKFQSNKEELSRNYLKLVNLVASINIPIYFMIILTAPILIRILYGPGFEDIETLVRILSLYVIFRSIGNPIIALIVATGRTELNFIWSLVTLVVMPIAVVIGSQYSIEAVAICLTLASALLFVPNWWLLVRKMIGVELLTYMYWIIPGLTFFKDRERYKNQLIGFIQSKFR